MSDETTLLPCPFCKGEAELKEYKPNVSGVAICKGCGARSPICKNDHTGGWRPKAIAAWNTRAHGTLTAEQVEKAIRDCSTYASYDGCTYYASGIRLQAIADELNRIRK